MSFKALNRRCISENCRLRRNSKYVRNIFGLHSRVSFFFFDDFIYGHWWNVL